MDSVRVRYLVCKKRKGGNRHYWQPWTALRAMGFQPRRLSDDFQQAIIEAQELNRQLDAFREGNCSYVIQPETIPWLIRLYRSDERFLRLAESTKVGYEHCLKTIEAWSERAKHPPIATIERKYVKMFYRSMRATPSTANAVLRVLRLLLQFAVDEGYLDTNPAAKPGLNSRPPRQAVWSDDQIAAFIGTAGRLERGSIALGVLLGVNLGQRQGDILRLTWSQYDGSTFTLKQSKTGVLLSVPVTSELRSALDRTLRHSPTVLVCETTNRPYQKSHFQHEFRRIAIAAGLDGLQFLDLRRSAVVRLAEAGCTVPEISAITGHQLDRTARILETYLPRTAPLARSAIRKLELHRKGTHLDE